MSLSWARKWSRKRLNEEFTAWWSNSSSANRPHLSRPLCPPMAAWKSLLGDTDRNLARATLSAISSHGDFAAYHRRFGHDDAYLTCPMCDQETAPDHIWTCSRNSQRISRRFFQKLVISAEGARWLSKKLGKAPRCLLKHRPVPRTPPTPRPPSPDQGPLNALPTTPSGV